MMIGGLARTDIVPVLTAVAATSIYRTDIHFTESIIFNTENLPQVAMELRKNIAKQKDISVAWSSQMFIRNMQRNGNKGLK